MPNGSRSAAPRAGTAGVIAACKEAAVDLGLANEGAPDLQHALSPGGYDLFELVPVSSSQPLASRRCSLHRSNSGEAIMYALKRTTDRRGVESLTIHDVRRWTVCELIEQVLGPPPFSAKDYEAWMGHRFGMGLRTYTRVRPGRLGGAAEAVGGRHAGNVININERGDEADDGPVLTSALFYDVDFANISAMRGL